MKSLTKTLVAATLAFGATAANAAIQQDGSFSSEAFVSVYDSSSKGTFTLDLGITVNTLVANVSNVAYSLSFDLSGLADWSLFKTNAGNDFSNTKYIVAAGGGSSVFAPTVLATGHTPIAAGTDFTNLSTAESKVNGQALKINTDAGDIANFAANNSTYVIDGDGHIGQHGAQASTLWQSPFAAAHDPQASYGEAVAFHMTDIPDFIAAQTTTFAGVWTLSGDLLTYGAAVSAVPLPAAVWMFGAGLMGLLGLNRRKSAAA